VEDFNYYKEGSSKKYIPMILNLHILHT